MDKSKFFRGLLNKKSTLLLSALFITSTFGFSSISLAANAPITCAIKTYNGHYLTAVGGGGRLSDVIHSDATSIKAWEKFTLIDQGNGAPVHYGFQTSKGYYLTAVDGGGRITDVIHS
ncbi:MAG: fascin domain-containing protein, partial [Bacteriovorax sp.]